MRQTTYVKTTSMRSIQSPKKSKTIRTSTAFDTNNDQLRHHQVQNQQMEFSLGEKDIEIDRLKTTVQAINDKLSVMNDMENDVHVHKDMLGQSEHARELLQISIKETTKRTQVQVDDHMRTHDSHINEIDQLNRNIQSMKEHQAKREQDHLRHVEELNQAHAQREQDHVKITENLKRDHLGKERDWKAEKEALHKDHHDVQTQLKNQNNRMMDDHNKKLNDHQDLTHKREQTAKRMHAGEIEKLKNDHANLIRGLKDDHARKVQTQNDDHHQALTSLSLQMQQMQEDHKNTLANLKNQHKNEVEKIHNDHHDLWDVTHQDHAQKLQDHHENHLADKREQERIHNDAVNKLQQELANNKHQHLQEKQQLTDHIEQQKRLHLNEKDDLHRKHAQMEEQLKQEKENHRLDKDAIIRQLHQQIEEQRSKYELRIHDLEIHIKQLESTIKEQKTTIISLESIIKVKEDVEDQLRMSREHEANMDAAKAQLQKELIQASDYILELEEKVYKAQKSSMAILKQLADAEEEIETLKQYIIDLKARIAVYIPVKDDQIDKKLAEFINNYPERQKLKIMFMRESSGVYQFGTKRVAVKVEQEGIKIRVGGGYLSIDEFLDQYTPAELEKLERKDPLKRFSEKIAIQKTIVGKELREDSPIRSPQRSPKKIAV